MFLVVSKEWDKIFLVLPKFSMKKVLKIYISNLEHGAGDEERMPVWVVWTLSRSD